MRTNKAVFPNTSVTITVKSVSKKAAADALEQLAQAIRTGKVR